MPNVSEKILTEKIASNPNAEIHSITEHAMEFKVAAKSYELVSTIQPIFFETPTGGLEPINTDWEDSDDPNFADAVTQARFAVYSTENGNRRFFPRKEITNEYITFSRPLINIGGYWIAAPSANKVREGSLLEWYGEGFKIDVFATPTGIKLNFVLDTPATVFPLRWNVIVTGLYFNVDGFYSSADNTKVLHYRPFIATDAVGNEKEVNVLVDGSYVELYPDTEGMVFPVTVDPSISVETTSEEADGYASGTDAFNDGSYYLPTGRSNTRVYDSYYKFSGLTALRNKDITNAYVRLYNADAAAANTGLRIYAQRNSSNPSPPTSNTDFYSRTLTTTYTSWSPTMTSTGTKQSPNFSSVVQQVVDNYPTSLSGLLLFIRSATRTTTTNIAYANFAAFDSTSYAEPYLYVAYQDKNTAPSISGNVSFTLPQSLTSLGSGNSPGTLSFTPTDAEDTTLTYQISSTSAFTTIHATGSATRDTVKSVNFGYANSYFTTGLNNLYVRLFDGVLYSPVKGVGFYVDKGAPENPEPSVSPTVISGNNEYTVTYIAYDTTVGATPELSVYLSTEPNGAGTLLYSTNSLGSQTPVSTPIIIDTEAVSGENTRYITIRDSGGNLTTQEFTFVKAGYPEIVSSPVVSFAAGTRYGPNNNATITFTPHDDFFPQENALTYIIGILIGGNINPIVSGNTTSDTITNVNLPFNQIAENWLIQGENSLILSVTNNTLSVEEEFSIIVDTEPGETSSISVEPTPIEGQA